MTLKVHKAQALASVGTRKIMSLLNAPDPSSPAFNNYMETLKTKSAAYDALIEAVNDAGFDTSSMTYDDTAEFLKALSLEGADAYAQSLIGKIHSCYENVLRVNEDAVKNAGITADTLANFQAMIASVTNVIERQEVIDAKLAAQDNEIHNLKQPSSLNEDLRRILGDILICGNKSVSTLPTSNNTKVFIRGIKRLLAESESWT